MNRLVVLPGLALFLALRPAVAQQVPHDSVVGAVQSLDSTSRTVQVVTGVGMVLRNVSVVVPVSLPVKSGSASVGIEQLRAGDVVRVTFGGRSGAFIAYTIERLGAMEAGRAGP